MAEGGILKRLETEVTCPLCLEIFTKPKKLPCEHVYCTQCLRGLALRSTTASIICPECRADTPVPPNFDVSQFVTPHQVNRLVEMYQQSLKLAHTQEATQEEGEPQPASCKIHKSQPLALYCETCESLVCRDCVLLSCAKKNHQYGFIDDMVKKYQTDLSQRLQPIKKFQQQMLEALEAISERERETQARKEEKLHQIQTTFDALIEILVQEREFFTEKVRKSFEPQEKINSDKMNEFLEIIAELKSITTSAENALKNPASEFLEDMVHIKQNLEQIEKLARNVSTQLALLPEKEVQLWNPANFREQCCMNTVMYKFEGSLQGCVNVPSHYAFSFDIDRKHPLEAHYDGSTEPVVVKKITPTQYSLSFLPQKRGYHKLYITYNKQPICGSPLSIYVNILPQQLKPIAKNKISNTGGIKCHKGKIYVVDGLHRTLGSDIGLKIFDDLAQPAKKLIRFRGLGEVLITGEHIYGTDVSESRIVKMDMDGNIMKSIGRKGTGPGEFHSPNGIRQSKDKKIYVCDSDNHRIQVFDDNLKLIRIIFTGHLI